MTVLWKGAFLFFLLIISLSGVEQRGGAEEIIVWLGLIFMRVFIL